jgi:hypothetical protein
VALTGFDCQRLSVYLSGLDQEAARSYRIEEDPRVVVCGASETRRHIFKRYADRYPKPRFKGRYKDYIHAAQLLFRPVDDRAVFAVFPEDNRSRFGVPTIMKSRAVGDRNAGCVLLPLDRQRHWGDVRAIAEQDIDFRDKADRLVWRGGTTGVFRKFNADTRYSSRFHVATIDCDNRHTDIGYSEIVQLTEDLTDIPLETIRARVLPPLSIGEQLRSKFLLSLEGNDVATGLKWMLASNSVVVMPHPTCETWACEGDLVPFEHYIPVRDDLADIDEVCDWCLSHPGDCEEIAMNGKRFIAKFLDDARERELCRAVVAEYAARVTFDLPFGPLERLAQRGSRAMTVLRGKG